MTLGEKQRIFSKLIAELILWAYDQGYEISFGDAYRDPRLHGEFGKREGYGNRNSMHKCRLAVDINLFKDGEYLSSTEDHRALGEKWESMHELCRWGGRFHDGNHYSMTHWGAM
jgi:hypothetical protein